jgi:hypothetical protein
VRLLSRLALLLTFLTASSGSADFARYWIGDPADVNPRLHGPVLVLAGGGGDYTAAMQEAIDRVRGCTDCDTKIDIAILRASGSDGYNEYLMEMNGVDSVV